MVRFAVAWNAEDKKVIVQPEDKELPKGHTIAGYVDERDLQLPVDKLDLKTNPEGGAKDSPVLLHYVETILLRNRVDDVSEYKLTIDKDVKKAATSAAEHAHEHTQEE